MANVLNFSTDNLITGVNVIDGNLYWTDDLNEPKKIEIDRWKEDDISSNNGVTTVGGRAFDHTDVTVIRPHPYKAIELDLVDYDDAEFDEARKTSPEPPFESIFPRFSYRWRYEDGQYSPYAPFTQAAFIPKERGEITFPNWENDVQYPAGSEVNYQGRAYRALSLIPDPGTGFNDDPVTFKSPAVWTDIGEAVISSEMRNYIEGYNTTLYNNVGRINLNNIPRGGADVVEIDILYTESISTTIYVLETLSIPEPQRGIDFILTSAYSAGVQSGSDFGATTSSDFEFLPLSYSLSTRKIYRALQENQLTRAFDNVPRLAKGQEVTANRLIYGNYLHQYNQEDGVTLNATTIPAESYPQYEDTDHKDYDVAIQNYLKAQSEKDGLHVKGNRTYEIGVAYIDSFGRQGAMLQNVSSFNDDGTLNEAAAFRTDFNQETREALQVTITSNPPSWADTYRYFIKDVSMDYHNLISYNIYNDGSESDINSNFIWIEFQSTDRNKVSEGDVLVSRRINDEVQGEKTRFLVQDIQNEAPDDVRRQVTQTISSSSQSNVGSIDHGKYDSVNGASDGSLAGRNRSAGETNIYGVDRLDGVAWASTLQVFNGYVSGNQGEDEQSLLQPDVFSSIDTTALTSPLYVRFANSRNTDNYLGGRYIQNSAGNILQTTRINNDQEFWTVYVQVLAIANENYTAGRSGVGDNMFHLTLGDQFYVNNMTGELVPKTDGTDNPNDPSLAGTPETGIPGAINNDDPHMEFISTTISSEAAERLQGRFWVRAARNGLGSQRSQFSHDGELLSLTQIWFETEPAVEASRLDLFWETSDTFCVCTDHGWPNKINWFNSVAEVNNGVFLESTRINDRFNTVQLVRGVRVNVPTERFSEERRPYGLTWSGIYNSRTGINRLNQFITADGITKELEPNYGSIQKLHTRNTNLVVLAEDKVFNVLADKDLLFNADGGGNVSAANVVLGQTTPYVGEFGIGKSPESFTSYGHQAWFADPVRGSIIQFTPATGGQSQLLEISKSGLTDFFRDRLFTSTYIQGMFDEYGDKVIMSLQGYDHTDDIIDPNDQLPGEDGNTTVAYDLDVQGWPSRMSYIPEGGLSLGNKFYSWKGGKMYMHNSNNVPRNNFYGSQYNSEVEVIFNDNPSSVKEFLTLSYEGTEGWEVNGINTESEDPALTSTWPWVKKENKFFAPIVSQENTYIIDPNGTILADDNTTMLSISGTKDKSGIKGFYNNVSLKNESTSKAELFAINTEAFVSSN